MLPLFQTKCVCAKTQFFLQNPVPVDTNPPIWKSTASGLSAPINTNGFPLWNIGDCNGVPLSNLDPAPRVGMFKYFL